MLANSMKNVGIINIIYRGIGTTIFGLGVLSVLAI